MNENVSVISECDNLEIENYLKSCGSYRKNTEVKFVESHGGGPSSGDISGLIQYSKCALNKFRNDLRECENQDIDRHIIIEKGRLNELLKSKIKEYLMDHPNQKKSPEKQSQPSSKIVHFKEKPKQLVRNVRRIKTLDRHIHCIGNKKPSKPAFVSRKSQQIHENKIKSLRIGRNIIVDPTPVTSFYPRRIFNDTKLESEESYRPTWHNRLMMQGTSESNCTIVSTTLTSQVVKKSEIKVLRYNFDWGDTDAVPHKTTGGKHVQNIDQTTQTENNVVTTKSFECYTEQLIETDKSPEIRDQSDIIEPSVVQVSSHETDENVQVTVGSSFVYEYESTFDESSSDSELSVTVRPTSKPDLPNLVVPQTKKPNILLESVVYEDKKSDYRDAEIQTEFKPIEEIINPRNIQISSGEDEESSQNVIELQLSMLNDEILQDKFKLLSVLRHSKRDLKHESNTTPLSEVNVSQSSGFQFQLTPLKPRQAIEFMPSPLELSSIRPLSLAHKNTAFDLSNEKCWKTINKIQRDAAQKPFSPKTETDDVAKRAAEKFLKSTVINTHRAAEPPEHNSTLSSSCVSNVMIITTSSSEYESDTTVTSHRYAQLRERFTNSDKISEGEVLSLGEVRKFTDNSD